MTLKESSGQLLGTSVNGLMRVIKMLAKLSISPRELCQLLSLLNPEQDEFQYRYEVLDLLSEIASDVLTRQSEWISDFWNIQRLDECIDVPEIEEWSGNTPLSGFVFHATLRLNDSHENHQSKLNEETAKYFFRRQLLFLGNREGIGFEVFLSQDGSISVAAITKKDYYAVTCSEAKLFDNKWHTITVAVVPSKRPFSYFTVSVHRDGLSILSTSLKISTVHETFTVCSIGAPPTLDNNANGKEQKGTEGMPASLNTGKSRFPSIFERALPSIVTQAPNYFTLPLKGFSSHDSSVKSVVNGLQDNMFGAPTSLQGQLASVLLADSSISLKSLFDTGHHYATVVSHESEYVDQFQKIAFCYSSAASTEGKCFDLSSGRKLNGATTSKNIHTISLQTALHSIGGVTSMLPVLQYSSGTEADLNSIGMSRESLEQLSDFSNKALQNPVAYFLVILRYLLNDKRLIQECADFVPLMNIMIQECDPQHLDVQVLMAMQILIENLLQHQLFKQKDTNLINSDVQVVNQFVEYFYENLVFNFKIWSRAMFQIIIGHVQYLQTLIKSDRKRFRKKFGVQFMLDAIRLHFIAPSNITESDAQAIRMALLEVVKVYIQKEVNIKEVGYFLSFLASVKHEQSLIEVLDLWTNHMEQNCKDQMFLLLLEPQTAELIYCLLIDRSFGKDLHMAVCRVGTIL